MRAFDVGVAVMATLLFSATATATKAQMRVCHGDFDCIQVYDFSRRDHGAGTFVTGEEHGFDIFKTTPADLLGMIAPRSAKQAGTAHLAHDLDEVPMLGDTHHERTVAAKLAMGHGFHDEPGRRDTPHNHATVAEEALAQMTAAEAEVDPADPVRRQQEREAHTAGTHGHKMKDSRAHKSRARVRRHLQRHGIATKVWVDPANPGVPLPMDTTFSELGFHNGHTVWLLARSQLNKDAEPGDKPARLVWDAEGRVDEHPLDIEREAKRAEHYADDPDFHTDEHRKAVKEQAARRERTEKRNALVRERQRRAMEDATQDAKLAAQRAVEEATERAKRINTVRPPSPSGEQASPDRDL